MRHWSWVTIGVICVMWIIKFRLWKHVQLPITERMVRRVGANYDEVTDSKEPQKSESVPCIRLRKFYRFTVRPVFIQRALVKYYAIYICMILVYYLFPNKDIVFNRASRIVRPKVYRPLDNWSLVLHILDWIRIF